MFDRNVFEKHCSRQTLEVIRQAEDECRRMGEIMIGPEHLLLGLIAETEGIAGEVLRKRGVTLHRARLVVAKMHKPKCRYISDIGFSVPSRHALCLAWKYAMLRGDEVVEPEHILLGLLRKEGNKAALVALGSLGVTATNLYNALMSAIAINSVGSKTPKCLSHPTGCENDSLI